MINNYNIKLQDYKIFLDEIDEKSVDFICIDPPYGKINGMQLSGQKTKIDWDVNIDWKDLFNRFTRVLKPGGTIAVFGQNPTYSMMIIDNIKYYKYELIWVKNNAAQGFHADKMPLTFTENIAIFIVGENSKNKRTFNNIAQKEEIDKNKHFTRWYAQSLYDFINIKRRKIHEILGHRKSEFFFCYTGKQFGLLSEAIYNELIEKFAIDKWEFFIPYTQLKEKWVNEKSATQYIKLDSFNYSKTLPNYIFEQKEIVYLHPTQKPVKLMERLIKMYSNEGNVILDCFMGSGSTGVAALNLNRKFLGCELDEQHFQTSKNRIENIK
ncbi:DNA-methyltransferase [Mycoplasma crocodyli]|uniref:Methyltransferase n=1 Tax=Mycoplasma crocodyli (strain ATCC 51981 / MP145) TaxID=512564 RepID=D5E646_MYCCM|nr:site-specific DNA-methyltransferase [Mycoplasma crocodyli]ADE19511.1 adenine-specific DNA modification methyltransferase [Mycoplasma crocodyli MP145]